jgi:quercetin dioxygenase-like cupin family protein
MNSENLVGKVAGLDGLIAYQAGAVVSRTVIDKPVGTVTLFAFDKGQGLSEHTAPFDALVNVIDGEVEITISGKPFKVKAGEMLIMPANDPHALKALTRFKMMLVMIKS